ncbi:hypothetical protein DER44DRAFT_748635 [Fusarium oxysporum]|nr:hypothetical protein DER44DRAFT_748635 [Fusarium oxysporum]
MASLDPIATAFIDYKYDEAVGFEGIDGIPCLACVATIDQDVRCRCLVNESGDTSCLLCDRNETVCDLYWNFVVNLSRRESQTSYRSSVSPTATGRQIWRRGRALGGCGSAWRELHMRLKNPDNLKILAVKESTSSREMLALSLLQSAGANLSLEEVRDRIAAVQPAYTSTGKSVGTLRDSLVRLSSAEAVVVFSVQERDSNSLPRNLPNYVVKPMIMTRVLAPRCAVVYSGGMPIYSGQK